MGINWSDTLYPDNPKRRDEVNKLAQSIQASVIQIYSNVRTVSKSLNQAYNKFEILPELNLGLTFQQSFDLIDNVMNQWKLVTEELKMDPKIPQKIKDLMIKFKEVSSVVQLPRIVKDVINDPAYEKEALVGGSVVGLVVGFVASNFILLSMATVVATTFATVALAGLAGAIIGGAFAYLIIGVIDGAIKGAKERDELEALKKKYQEMDDNLRKDLVTLENDVASVQRAIIKALPDD